jgi:hypothetical protein
MSYIPNSAMPHATAQEEERQGIDWQAYADQGRELARQAADYGQKAWRFARARPGETAAGAAALVAGLAFAAWRSNRRSSRLEFA